MGFRTCSECGECKDDDYYSSNQWRRGPGASKCEECVNDAQQPATCPYCSRELRNRNGLQAHMRSCIPTCTTCSRTFGSENSLKQHMKTHAPREIECPFCHGPKKYKNGANVVAHVEYGYCKACRGKDNARDQIFGFVNRNAPGLTQNLQIGWDNNQTPDIPYRCTYCSKGFKNLSGQMNHEDDVHGNRRDLRQLM